LTSELSPKTPLPVGSAPQWGVQLGIFALSALVSLAASVFLVSHLERVGERLGLSEALLGLLAALAADGPEITASVTAIAGGHGTVGIGVTLGSNVFNLAALLGLSAAIAGRVGFHRRSVLLEGGVGLWIAFLGLAVVAGLVRPVGGLLLALVVFVPYVAYSAEHPAVRARLHLPGRWSDWLAHALAEEEAELAVAIRPRRGDRRDAGMALAALIVVVAASVAMEQAATSLGSQAGLSAIVIGGLILAGVTSLPNAVAAVYLASRGRGAATLSEAFNSNAFNMIVGLMVPGVILGLARPMGGGMIVALAYVLLTIGSVALAWRGRGLSRRAGALIIVGYLIFAAVLATR
jgi:cation:H+ antiporter